MSIDKHLQRENREKKKKKKEVWEMKKSFFISAGCTSANNSRWESGLGGRWHFGNVQVWMGCKPCRLEAY